MRLSSFTILRCLLMVVYPPEASRAACTTANTFLSPANQSLVARVVDSSDAAVFVCNVTCDDGGQTPITWTIENFNGTAQEKFVRQGSYPFISIDGDISSVFGTYSNRLTILRFSESLDGAVLRCLIPDSPAGIYYLNTYRPPQLANNTGTIDITENSNRSISLASIGLPIAFPYPLTLSWTKDKAEVINSSRIQLGYPEAIFTNVSRSDTGRYVLTASNYRLDDPSQLIGTAVGSFTLNVIYGPDLKKEVNDPVSVLAGWNQTAALVCASAVDSNPPATIAWKDNNNGHVDLTQERFRQDNQLTLSIDRLTAADVGHWACVVTGGKGFEARFIEVTLLDRPPAPINVMVGQLHATWVQVTWSAVTPTPASASVSYTITATDPLGGVVSSPAIFDATSSVLSGLLPNTRYSVAVTTTAMSGSIRVKGSVSLPYLVDTEATVPKLQCSKVSSTNTGGLSVAWIFDHTGGLSLSDVFVSYSINGGQEVKLVTEKEMGMDGNGRPTSVELGNVTAGWTYNFSVVAHNSRGSATTTCPPVTPSLGLPQIPGIIQSSSSAGSVVLQVSTQASGAPPSGWVEFEVRAEHTTGKEQILFRQESREYSDGKEVELKLSGFPMVEEDKENTYNFFVSCRNKFGTSNESDPVSITVDFSSFPESLVGGAIAGGAALLAIVVVVLVIAMCLCKRKRSKNLRIIHIPQLSGIEAPETIPTENLTEEEDHGYDRLSAIREVHQLHTDSASSSHMDSINRTDSAGMWLAGTQNNNMHLRQKSGSSFSSGTASETTHDRYPMVTPIVATMVAQPQANGLSRIVHSSYESPKRESNATNLQHKPYAVNPLAGYSASTQQADCRNFSPSLRQSFKSEVPSSAIDLCLGGRPAYQHCLETVSYHNSSNGEIQKLSGLSRQSSIAGTYPYSSSDV